MFYVGITQDVVLELKVLHLLWSCLHSRRLEGGKWCAAKYHTEFLLHKEIWRH